jgi:hypothetical protein
MRTDPQIVLEVIIRLGTARLGQICEETGLSRRTVSDIISRFHSSKGIIKSGHGWKPSSGQSGQSGQGLFKINTSPSGIDISLTKKSEDMLGIGAVNERSTSATPARLGGGGQCVAATEAKIEHPSVPATMRYVIERILRDRRKENQKEGLRHVDDETYEMRLWDKRKLKALQELSDDLFVAGGRGWWGEYRERLFRRADALVPDWRDWMAWAVRDMARQESRRRTKAVNDALSAAVMENVMYPASSEEDVEEPVQAALSGAANRETA